MGIPQEKEESNRVLLYKGLKGKASLPTDDLIRLIRSGRYHHSMAFQSPNAFTKAALDDILNINKVYFDNMAV